MSASNGVIDGHDSPNKSDGRLSFATTFVDQGPIGINYDKLHGAAIGETELGQRIVAIPKNAGDSEATGLRALQV
jgi:hypothetical protein